MFINTYKDLDIFQKGGTIITSHYITLEINKLNPINQLLVDIIKKKRVSINNLLE